MTMAIRGEIWTGEEERVGWKEMCERDDFWPRTLAACCFISRCRVYHPLITGQRKSSDLAPPRDGDVQLPPWHRITKKQGRAASMLRARPREVLRSRVRCKHDSRPYRQSARPCGVHWQ